MLDLWGKRMKIYIFATDDVGNALVKDFDATDAKGALEYLDREDRSVWKTVIGFGLDKKILQKMAEGGVTIDGTIGRVKFKIE